MTAAEWQCLHLASVVAKPPPILMLALDTAAAQPTSALRAFHKVHYPSGGGVLRQGRAYIQQPSH